jgi:hypothetical protein
VCVMRLVCRPGVSMKILKRQVAAQKAEANNTQQTSTAPSC